MNRMNRWGGGHAGPLPHFRVVLSLGCQQKSENLVYLAGLF